MYHTVYCNHRIAASLSAIKMVCLRYIILNTLYTGDKIIIILIIIYTQQNSGSE